MWRSEGGDAEVVRQGEFNLGQLLSGEVVDRLAHEVVGVDRTDLIDEESSRSSCDIELGPVNRRLSRS